MSSVNRSVAAFIACLFASTAQPHSASNAYLTVTSAPPDAVLHVQWDVALRDLEFVLGINRSGDGKLTWGELASRKEDVARYVYAHIHFSSRGRACTIEPLSMQVDDHADGAYAAMFFDFRCGDRLPAELTVDYSLFFDIDPSHRGIFVLRNGDAVSSALLSPENPRLKLAL